MTTVLFHYTRPNKKGGLDPAKGHLTFKPTKRRIEDNTIVLPLGFSVDLDHEGKAEVELSATDGSWAWGITESLVGSSSRTKYFAVPVMPRLPAEDLVAVDPATLELDATPEPVWWAELKATIRRVAINAHDFGAISGSANSTQGIQDAIDFAHERGGGWVFISGQHWVQSHIENDTGGSPLRGQGGIVLRSNVTLDLRGAILKAIPNDARRYNIVRIEDCSSASIVGGHIQGERHERTDVSRGEWGMGVHIASSSNISVQGTLVSDCWGDGIYVAAEPGHYNENVHITNVTCRGNRRQGMTIVGGRNIHTYRSVFTETIGTLPQSGVDVEPNSPDTVCENITFRDCDFTNNETYGFTAMGGTIKNITLDGCRVAGNRTGSQENGQLRFVRNISGITLRDTVVEGSSNDIALELRAHDALIDGCVIDGKVQLLAHDEVSRYKITNSLLEDNLIIGSNLEATIHGNTIETRTGQYTAYQPMNSVVTYTGNVFGATELAPVRCGAPNNSTFIVNGNTFRGYGEYAVYTRSGDSTLVQNNQFQGSDTSRAGVYLGSGTTDSIVTGNTQQGGGVMTRVVGQMSNVRVAGNVAARLIEGTPQPSTAHNVWIEQKPFEWWHDGQVVEAFAPFTAERISDGIYEIGAN